MKFDVVIGNPPYNNDLYLDFVQMGHKLASKCDCWITPAKWQAKGGEKNEAFRSGGYVTVKKDGKTTKEYWDAIVPHMSKIVYYPDCLDVFGISEPSGVCYYIIDGKVHTVKEITNSSVLSPTINSTMNRSILNKETLWNYGNTIVEKIQKSHDYKPYKLTEAKELKAYTINLNKQLLNCLSRVWDWNLSCIKSEYIGSGGYLFDKDGKAKVFCVPKLITENMDNSSGTSMNVFTSDNIDEAKSFTHWILTKFLGFLIIINRYAQNIMNDTGWRFVPDPGPFDRIFEDKPLQGYTPDINGEYVDANGNKHCSLYVKYNLTPEEIEIIESVIKERK